MSLSSADFAVSFIFLRAVSTGTSTTKDVSGIEGSASIASTVVNALILTSSISSVGFFTVSFWSNIPGARSILNSRQSDLASNLSAS